MIFFILYFLLIICLAYSVYRFEAIRQSTTMYFILIVVLVRHDLLHRLFIFFFGHTLLGLRIEPYAKIFVVVTTLFCPSFPYISTEVYSIMSTDSIAHFRVQYRMISSEEFSDFFQRQKRDEALLTKLKENMKTIAKKVHDDSFYQVITEKAWLNVLHRIILDLDDLLHYVAEFEEKFKIITTLWSYCCNSTFRIFFNKYRPSTSPEKCLEDRMKEIIKEMEDLAAQEIDNSDRNWVEAVFGISDEKLKEKWGLTNGADLNSLPLGIYDGSDYFAAVFGIFDKKLQERRGWTNGTDLNEMPVETGVGSTRPPETSKISDEGASEIPLKMTESSSDTDDPFICQANSVYPFEAIRKSKMMYFILILFLVFVLVRHDLLHRLFNFFFFGHALLGLRIEQYKEIYVVVTTFVCSSFPIISFEVSKNRIAHFHEQHMTISSKEFSDFFQRQKLDEALLKKLKENMKTIADMFPVDSFSKVITEPGDWEPSLNVLHGIILNLDYLLHDVAKSEAKFKIITALWSYYRNSTIRIYLKKSRPDEKGIEDRMKQIIEEMEHLAKEIYDGSNYFEAAFDILDKKCGRTNGTDLNEMPVETGDESTRPPETSKISNEDSSIKHEGASEIPLKMTESSSDTDDPINIWYSQISSLESLKVSEISQLLKLPPRLHTLKIEGCDALKSLPEELMLNNIHLQQLYIIDCCFLESFSLDHLPTTLKSLYIRNCRKLKFPSPSETMQHAFLEHLCIGSSCDSLSSFHLSLFPELRSLAIWDCVNFSSISISENHKSLDALEIRDCPELLSFLEEGLHTPNLTSIFLSNCKNLKGIPKPMDKLISLRSFFINGCPELSSIIHGCFPENLSSLCITDCPKLTPSIQWKMHELNNLSCFEIEDGCIDLKSFPEQNLLPRSLNSLRISRLSNLEFLDYKGLECLTSLETLKINGCNKLQSFPEEGLPSSVTYLYINECSLLKARFQNKRGKEWYKIAHVTHIEIDEEVMS